MKTLIVDDEPLARRVLQTLLRDDPDIASVTECATGESARTAIAAGDIDIAFLDVQMPGINGFEALGDATDGELPVVVFVTAHEQYALDAIEAGAADYLLKPFDESRFQRALARAKDRVRQLSLVRKGDELIELLSAARESSPAPTPSNRISVHDGARVQLIDAEQITWIEADDKHVQIHLEDGATVRARRTLAEIERELDPRAFLRVHRSCVVALRSVRALEQGAGGGAWLVMRDGARVAVSRSRVAGVRVRLG